MPRALAVLAVLLGSAAATAAELPSFLQAGDQFCTSETDFDDLVAHGRPRANSATETCQQMVRPIRVAVLSGQGGVKTKIRVINGPLAYTVGWTNGRLPLAK